MRPSSSRRASTHLDAKHYLRPEVTRDVDDAARPEDAVLAYGAGAVQVWVVIRYWQAPPSWLTVGPRRTSTRGSRPA
jgi:hypothetical protein